MKWKQNANLLYLFLSETHCHLWTPTNTFTDYAKLQPYMRLIDTYWPLRHTHCLHTLLINYLIVQMNFTRELVQKTNIKLFDVCSPFSLYVSSLSLPTSLGCFSLGELLFLSFGRGNPLKIEFIPPSNQILFHKM